MYPFLPIENLYDKSRTLEQVPCVVVFSGENQRYGRKANLLDALTFGSHSLSLCTFIVIYIRGWLQ